MIANSLIKALILVNHKVFIKIIDLKDQEKHLVFIKLKKD